MTRDGGASRRTWQLLVIMVGVLMAAVDTTIVVLALPVMRSELRVGFSAIVWVVLGYLLVITLLSTQVGRLGDMFGRVRMYEAGFLLFVVGSALCGLAWNEAAIVAFRVLQGIGGAFISAQSGAIVADLFPAEERGRAYGYTTIGWNIGAVLGILLGGFLVTYLSWRWIFWINVPIGVGALLVALAVLPASGGTGRQRLDLLGMGTLGLGLLAVLVAMIHLTSSAFDGTTLLLLTVGVLLLAAFVAVEARVEAPMVQLRLFRVPTLTPSFLASFFQGLANFAVLFLVTMYLQGVRGLTPLSAALLLIPGYVVGSLAAPISGRLADRFSPVLPATLGLAVQVVALLLYAELGLRTPLWVVSVVSMVNGLGGGGFFPANSAAVMKAAPPAVFGLASGMLRTFGNVGMIFSFTLALLVASSALSRSLAFAIFIGDASLSSVAGRAFLSGIHAAFYTSVAALVVAGVLSALRARRIPLAGSLAEQEGD